MSTKSAEPVRSRGRETDSQSTIAEYLCRGRDQMTEMVEDRPTRSVLTCCALGLGIGFFVGRMMGQPATSSFFDRQSAERLGQQLLQRVEKSMPEALRERLFS
jgi:hypothetical protein